MGVDSRDHPLTPGLPPARLIGDFEGVEAAPSSSLVLEVLGLCGEGVRVKGLQGYLVHNKLPAPLKPPQDPRHRPTVGSYGDESSCK